jgi:hypothetical protein
MPVALFLTGNGSAAKRIASAKAGLVYREMVKLK